MEERREEETERPAARRADDRRRATGSRRTRERGTRRRVQRRMRKEPGESISRMARERERGCCMPDEKERERRRVHEDRFCTHRSERASGRKKEREKSREMIEKCVKRGLTRRAESFKAGRGTSSYSQQRVTMLPISMRQAAGCYVSPRRRK